MALNDKAIFTAAKGYVLTAGIVLGENGAPDEFVTAPTVSDIQAFTETSLPTGFELIGHTSADELPEFGFDGGDTEVRGSWQTEALKTVQTDALVDYVTLNLMQFDDSGLEMYYGAENDPNAEVGEFVVETNNTEGVTKSLLIVMVDGDFKIGFYAPKATIKREDAISLETDSFAYLPLRATFLKATGQPLYKWIAGHLNTGAGS